MGGIIHHISHKRTIILQRYAIAKSCYDGRGYTDFTVNGLLVKHQWLGMTWYRIKVYRPRVRGVEDGCFESRAKLKSYTSAIRQELKRLLYEHKYGNKEASK